MIARNNQPAPRFAGANQLEIAMSMYHIKNYEGSIQEIGFRIRLMQAERRSGDIQGARKTRAMLNGLRKDLRRSVPSRFEGALGSHFYL